MKHNATLGRLGEEYVSDHLIKNGYKILERNFRTGFSETDIIAKKGDIIAFIEVKTRSGADFGEPFEAITKSRQRQIKNTARLYMLKHDGYMASFDVAEIVAEIGRGGLEVKDFNYIENSFE